MQKNSVKKVGVKKVGVKKVGVKKNRLNRLIASSDNSLDNIPAIDDLVWALCGFAGGILTSIATTSPNINLSIALIIVVLLGIGIYLLRARLLASTSSVVFLLCLFFALGFLRADWREQNTGAHLLVNAIDEITFSARVRSLQGRVGSVRLSLDEIDWGENSNPPQRILLRYYGDKLAKTGHRTGHGIIGQRITVTARLTPPSRALLPSTFDFRHHARFAKIDAYGVLKEIHATSHTTPLASTNERFTPSLLLARLRASIGERLDHSMSRETAPIARALLIGERSSIARAELQRIRDAGLAHILAISGLHLGLFAFGTFILLRRASTLLPHMCQSLPSKKIAAAIALTAALCYMLLAGASVPTQRAFIMSGLVLCAVLCDRSAISLRVVALAALLILALRPESILQAGFQMSFAAAASLVAFYEVFTKTRHNALLSKLRLQAPFLLLTTTLIASMATAPFVIYHFGRIAQYGLLSNLLVVPILGLLVLPFGALSLLLMPFGLEGITLKVMGWGIIWIKTIADWVSGLEHSVLLLGKPPPSFLFLSAMGLFVIVFFLRRRKLLLFGFFLCGCAVVVMEKSPAPLALFGGDSRSLWLRDYSGAYWRFGGWQNSFEYRQWVSYLGNPRLYSASSKDVSSEGIWLDGAAGLFRCEQDKRRGNYSCRTVARGGVLEISSHRQNKVQNKVADSRITFTCEQAEPYRNPRTNHIATYDTSCRSFSYSLSELAANGSPSVHALVLYPRQYSKPYSRASGFRVRSTR